MSFAELEALIPRSDTELSLVCMESHSINYAMMLDVILASSKQTVYRVMYTFLNDIYKDNILEHTYYGSIGCRLLKTSWNKKYVFHTFRRSMNDLPPTLWLAETHSAPVSLGNTVHRDMVAKSHSSWSVSNQYKVKLMNRNFNFIITHTVKSL